MMKSLMTKIFWKFDPPKFFIKILVFSKKVVKGVFGVNKHDKNSLIG